MKYESVYDLPRNDLEACRVLWQSRDITADEWRTMLLLQDDPETLVEAARGWSKQS